MKSKKKKTNKSNKLEQDLDIKLVVDNSDPGKPMIDRKATQAEIDIDKHIRRLLRTGYYNYNQIASMIKGANLERVKQVDNERRKTS